MAHQGVGFFDGRGHFFKTPDEATISDLSALLGRIGEGESLAPGIAQTLLGRREDLERLWIPDLYLHTLSTFSSSENVLMLGAVVDTELLAVHSAIHDVLASKVKNPNAYYLPGNWVPHCTLVHDVDDEAVKAAFAAVFPVEPIRAKVREVSVVDTQTGEIDVLKKASTAPR